MNGTKYSTNDKPEAVMNRAIKTVIDAAHRVASDEMKFHSDEDLERIIREVFTARRHNGQTRFRARKSLPRSASDEARALKSLMNFNSGGSLWGPMTAQFLVDSETFDKLTSLSTLFAVLSGQTHGHAAWQRALGIGGN